MNVLGWRRKPAPAPIPATPTKRCDFDLDGYGRDLSKRCVGPLGHKGMWHKNPAGDVWYGVNFDRP